MNLADQETGNCGVAKVNQAEFYQLMISDPDVGSLRIP